MIRATKPEHAALRLDAITEDIFGINLKGATSILTLWVSPLRYVDAARHADWQGRYTPAIRLWLFFFALFSAFKVGWLSRSVGLVEAWATGFSDANVPLPPGTGHEDIAREAMLLLFTLLPVLQIIATFAVALVYPYWGQPTTAALRQRLFFATIVPSASLMPVVLSVMVMVPSHALTAYAMGLAVLTFGVDVATGYRGAFAALSRWSRLWRSALLAFVIVGINVLLSILTQIAVIVWINVKYGGSSCPRADPAGEAGCGASAPFGHAKRRPGACRGGVLPLPPCGGSPSGVRLARYACMRSMVRVASCANIPAVSRGLCHRKKRACLRRYAFLMGGTPSRFQKTSVLQ